MLLAIADSHRRSNANCGGDPELATRWRIVILATLAFLIIILSTGTIR
jgi:hypothetical protein